MADAGIDEIVVLARIGTEILAHLLTIGARPLSEVGHFVDKAILVASMTLAFLSRRDCGVKA